jgi:hydrogenase-4 component B
MSLLVAASLLLILGALAAVAFPGSEERRAQLSLAAQALATLLVERVALPILAGGPELRESVNWPGPVGEIPIHVDAIGAFWLAFSLPMTFLGSIYALGYLRRYFGKRHVGVHFALLALTSLAFVMVYTIENGLVFFFGWELAALTAWLLVIFDYPNQNIRFAGFNYLVSTHLSLVFLVAAFLIMKTEAGSWSFSAFGQFLERRSFQRDAVFVLLIISFGLKIAFFPFHSWLPRAHSAAPAHVSALMSGVIHKAGIFGMVRFVLLVAKPSPWMGWFLIVFSLSSAVIGVVYTVTQRDLKRLLGYSSTENVGIAGIGIGVGSLGLAWNIPALTVLGFTGAILHVLNHALFKCLLFYGAGAVFRATHTIDIEELGGLQKKMPRTALLFLVGALAISALPPLNGFVSEVCIYSGLFSGLAPDRFGRAFLVVSAALLAFVGAVSALSMTRAFGVVFLGSPRDPHVHADGEAPSTMLVPMVVHALGCCVIGLAPAAGIKLAAAPASLFVRLHGEPALDALASPLALVGPVASVGLALVAVTIAVAWVRHVLVKASRRHVTWGCGYKLPTARMQYTGTSFSQPFATLFEGILAIVRHQKLPRGPFPREGHVIAHCVDAVERRLFKAIGRGEQSIAALKERLGDESRISLAIGLAVLVAAVGLVVSSSGAGP